jgi:hypothetical protein
VPAEKKSKPQRMLIVFLACVLTLALSVLLALLMQGVFGPEGATVFERRVQKAARRVARFYRVRIE